MTDFRLTRPALEDLLELAEFIARDDIEAAERVVGSLETAMRGLAERPGKGHARTDLTDEPDLRFWPVHSVLVVYRSGTSPLEVVRIVHASRDLRRESKEE